MCHLNKALYLVEIIFVYFTFLKPLKLTNDWIILKHSSSTYFECKFETLCTDSPIISLLFNLNRFYIQTYMQRTSFKPYISTNIVIYSYVSNSLNAIYFITITHLCILMQSSWPMNHIFETKNCSIFLIYRLNIDCRCLLEPSH